MSTSRRLHPATVAIGLYACLVLAVVADTLDAPVAVRAPLTIVGVLLAPGWAWVSLVRPQDEPIGAVALAAAVSVALCVVSGVIVNALGITVEGALVGVVLLIISAPALALTLRRSGPAPRIPRPTTAFAGALAALAVFVTVIEVGASWMHLVDEGPYARMSYAGSIAQLTGPVKAPASGPLSVPVRMVTSTGQPWSGTLTVRDGATTLVDREVSVSSGGETTLAVPSPATKGLHDLTIVATPDAATAETGIDAPLSLTLRVRVSS